MTNCKHIGSTFALQHLYYLNSMLQAENSRFQKFTGGVPTFIALVRWLILRILCRSKFRNRKIPWRTNYIIISALPIYIFIKMFLYWKIWSPYQKFRICKRRYKSEIAHIWQNYFPLIFTQSWDKGSADFTMNRVVAYTE
jgi:hypothetical protein